MLLLTNPSIRLLFMTQGLFWSYVLIGITLTAIVGFKLSPVPALATLPLALLMVGNLLSVQPLSVFMQARGRRPGLMTGAALGIAGGLTAALGIWTDSFLIFCLAALPMGTFHASAQYYRFAALEAVDEAHKGRAAGFVLGGGVFAAIIAPTLIMWSRDASDVPFMGSYLTIAVLALCNLLLLSRLREGTTPRKGTGGLRVMRSLLARPVIRAAMITTAAAQGIMVLIMTSTPLAMSFGGLDTNHAATVIQWHVLGMFLPAFAAGPLVDLFGSRRVGMLGAVIMAASLGIALMGETKALFLISSFLLGVGWNLMLLAGTTLLNDGHDPSERGHAQGLMELGNGSMATTASFSAGALITSVGWTSVNIGVIPILLLAMAMLLSVWHSRPRYAAGADSPSNREALPGKDL